MTWHFKQLVRGYTWTHRDQETGTHCRLIIWQGHEGTWAASAVLHRDRRRVRETFESYAGEANGLNYCFEWLRQFVIDQSLPPLEVMEAWARLLREDGLLPSE